MEEVKCDGYTGREIANALSIIMNLCFTYCDKCEECPLSTPSNQCGLDDTAAMECVIELLS